MNKKVKALIGIMVFAAVVAGAYVAYNSLSKSYGTNDIAEPAPSDAPPDNSATGEEEDKRIQAIDFTLTDVDGNEVKLSDFIGKPIVLNFWASWCPPCKAELPDFDKVYGEVKSDVIFLMVDLVDGQRETVEKGSKYIEDNGYSFPVYYDTSQEAALSYGIYSIPTTLFIDKDGYIVAGQEGQMSEAALRKGVSLINPD